MVTVIRQSHTRRLVGTFAVCAVALGMGWMTGGWSANAADAKVAAQKKSAVSEKGTSEKKTGAKAEKGSDAKESAPADKDIADKGTAAKAEATPIQLKEAYSTGAAASIAEQVGYINEMIRQGWIQNNIEPSAVAEDGEWLRRVYLDIAGHVPPVEDVDAFIADKDKSKRAKMIDKLLDDPAYVRNWTTNWTNLLIGRGNGNANMGGPQRRAALQKFLREAFAKNRPWNDVVSDLISAEGNYQENGAVNFLMAHLNDGQIPATAITAKLFLGLQVQCTQCHNHPFNTWKQNQFWEYNSIFKQCRENVVQKYDEKTGRMVFDYAELVHQDFEGPVYFEPRNGLMKVAYPRYEEHEIDPSSPNRRKEFAKLITTGERTQVADAMVNRMWGHFFGYGFTKPVDDMGPHNAASHPELLEKLGKDFVKSKYDLKQLIRWICNSEAYNLTSKMVPPPGGMKKDDPNYGRYNERDNPANGERPLFTHMYVKSLSAEQLYDSLIIATNAHKSGRSNWEQAEQQRRMWMQQFVLAFGTDENDESTTFNGTIPQALMMMNGELVQNAISTSKGSYLNTVLSDKGNEQAKLRELYMSTLSRIPTSKEIAAAKGLIKKAKTPIEGYQDLFWALLNSNEFIFNH